VAASIPVRVRLTIRQRVVGMKRFVELRIGEGRGETRVALLTPRTAQQLAYRLLVHAAEADVLKRR